MIRRLAVTLAASALLSACQSPVSALPGTIGTTSSASCVAISGKADARCTPGLANQQVTQANIAQTICRKGWTATVRPPTSYTTPIKRQLMARYGITAPPAAVELDHLIPLEVGGDPRSQLNLFPEMWDGPQGAHVKDGQENALNRAVCNGRVKLADAQRQMVARWTHN